jgi:poly(3-hydroxybutyrate) depolymerase
MTRVRAGASLPVKWVSRLAAEQKAVNNPHTLFHWFNPEDITRDEGEAASIAAMVGRHGRKIPAGCTAGFITGLSVGGAMSAVMLALYPELFAGGDHRRPAFRFGAGCAMPWKA